MKRIIEIDGDSHGFSMWLSDWPLGPFVMVHVGNNPRFGVSVWARGIRKLQRPKGGALGT